MAGLTFLLTFVIIFSAIYPERLGKWLARVKAGYSAAIGGGE